MADEKKQNPRWAPKDMQLDETVNLTLASSKPISEGTSKYGKWQMWLINITNQDVYDRNNNKIENYSGEAIVFPSTKLAEKFLEATGGTNENVKISITKKAKTNDQNKLYTDYDMVMTGEGTPKVVDNSVNQNLKDVDTTNLNAVEEKFVNEAKATKKMLESANGQFTKEQFVSGAKTYNINNDRAEELWNNFMQ